MRATDQFHLGIVVEDLDASLEELGGLFGYEWCPQFAAEIPVVLPKGEITVDLRFVYSKSEPRMEAHSQRAWDALGTGGRLRDPSRGVLVRRHGCGRASAGARAGCVEEARGIYPDGAAMWAYHRSPRGPRIELVSRGLQSGLEQYWASG